MSTSYIPCPHCDGEIEIEVRWYGPEWDVNVGWEPELREEPNRCCAVGCPLTEREMDALIEARLEAMARDPYQWLPDDAP